MTEPPNHRLLVISQDEAAFQGYAAALGRRVPRPAADDAAPPAGFDAEWAPWGEDAVAAVAAAVAAGTPYAVVFIEAPAAPPSAVVETIQRIWASDPDVQAVVWAPRSGDIPGLLLERLGSTDRLMFLRRPFAAAEVRQAACALAAKWNLAREAHLRRAELESLASERTASLRAEVQERRASEEQFRRMAMHDPLTGLPNRAHILDRLRRCIARQKRQPSYRFALLFLDLDSFKTVNDTLGHDAGDALLVAIARRTGAAIRTLDSVAHFVEDTTARLGGDEFVVLLDGLRRSTDAVIVAERIQQRLAEPFDLSGYQVAVTASIGIAVAERPYERPEEVLRDADAAMYRAKSSGKARYATFDQKLHDDGLARLKLENELRRAVDEGQFRLVYEPIVATETAGLIGFEALIRWDHPDRGTVSPAEFLPVAEETGLIIPIGRWVLNEACRQLRAWTDQCPDSRAITMSVNLSRRQVMEPALPAAVERVLRDHRIEGRRLVLDIAESAMMERFEAITGALHELRALGVSLHMDDFGTGFSTLNCLHTFPIDALKVDRSFIENMAARQQLAALLHAVLSLAQSLNIRVIAEGVETAEQLALLLALGCDCIQGYHISKTLSADEAGKLLTGGIRWPKAA